MQPAPKSRILAGIIPITGRENTLGLPWDDCLQPLSYEVTALERSVYECAVMNCDSIWIICNDDTAPLIKKRIGDYVLNPNIYDVRALKSARADIRSGKSYYGSYQGKTVRDNLYLPFSFTPEDWLELRRGVNEKNTGGSRDLSIEERWSAKNFTLDKIFNNDRIDIDKKIEIEEYYTLDSWAELREYYKSDLIIKKMPKSMAKPFTL